MDFLKAEIAAKRKAESSAASAVASGSGSGSVRSGSAEPPQKYQRRGEVERARNEVDESKRRELREARERRDRAREEKRRLKEGIVAQPEEDTSAAAGSISSSKEPTAGETAAAAALTTARGEAFNISPTEAITRLRAKGQPIRLFGESDKERRLRLRALELIEERGERVGQNDFMRALAGAEGKDALEELERTRQADGPKAERDEEKKKAKEEEERLQDNPKNREGIGMDSLLDLSLVRKDVNRVYPMIYYTLKGLMSDWEQALAERPLEVRQSTQGKMVAATQVQSREYMKPFFKALRQRATLPDVTMRVAEIVHHMQKRDYRAANDSYLQMSIGNAAWPMGVTMVGIHERSGREKIFSSNVAHVLNDEVSRKYIQSLKRLMTFAQTKYPPKDPSMLMG